MLERLENHPCTAHPSDVGERQWVGALQVILLPRVYCFSPPLWQIVFLEWRLRRHIDGVVFWAPDGAPRSAQVMVVDGARAALAVATLRP